MPDHPPETLVDLTAPDAGAAVVVRLVADGEAGLPAGAAFADFKGQAGRVFLQTEGEGAPLAWVGLGSEPVSAAALHAALRGLPARLPPGDWRLEPRAGVDEAEAALAWALGAYAFERYTPPPPRPWRAPAPWPATS